jgi:aminoacyl tRNA synthase complex-interacting multifunctional protein 1
MRAGLCAKHCVALHAAGVPATALFRLRAPFSAPCAGLTSLLFSRRPAYSTVCLSAAAEAADAPAAAPAAAEPTDATKLDIRVGRIVSCELHPDAESLYVEQIDLGEAEGPRTIISGLVKYIPREQLQDRMVLVLANLKPRNMRGIKSNGMLLCASNADHTVVEPLAPAAGTAVGERAFFGPDGAGQGDPAVPNQLQKKKIWEACQPLLRTDAGGVAGFQGAAMMTSAGAVTASLTDASIS